MSSQMKAQLPELTQIAKKRLRTLMKKRLADLSGETIQEQSMSLFRRLQAFEPYIQAKRIAVYLSMPTGELQTDAIVRDAFQAGKQVFVPYMLKNKARPYYEQENQAEDGTFRAVMDMVQLHSHADYESLKRDRWGIPTIGDDTIDQREHIIKNAKANSAGLDLILLPGVAFDVEPQSGTIRRLGHGRGYYDYFLGHYHHLREYFGQQNPLLYGLALQEQVLHPLSSPSSTEEVPVGPFDRPLHGLLVGNGEIIESRARQPQT
ncbi:hypothetical protein BP5796_01490 [Coleophoma crateriformis]|uniref:5-formyltetrahydrofolate cyclo-ligase n=1 Tax=Coleophoma crateriformis TaxID=565419 RepID=A0A3D8T0L2_9HELO|nr:hypothetical protein BP5796_01490 [Coleophoma crateriformis]